MKKYAFVIDIGKCENCNNCFLACKDEHCGNDWDGYTDSQPLHGHRWMHIKQRERGKFPHIDVAYLPQPCMHCDDAPCVSASQGMLTKREDGIVLIDQDTARGKKELLKTCPHGALWWNEEKNIVQKCTMCAHLLDSGWQVPRCVQSCPTGALSFFAGSEEELQARVAAEDLAIFPPGLRDAGSPRCYYKNIHRYTTEFIAGSLARTTNGVEECAAGVTVSLRQEGKVVAEKKSDDFGDFRFDNLLCSDLEYSLEISLADFKIALQPFLLTQSLNLGVIYLERGKSAAS